MSVVYHENSYSPIAKAVNTRLVLVDRACFYNGGVTGFFVDRPISERHRL
jgi:hypothetical protein